MIVGRTKRLRRPFAYFRALPCFPRARPQLTAGALGPRFAQRPARQLHRRILRSPKHLVMPCASKSERHLRARCGALRDEFSPGAFRAFSTRRPLASCVGRDVCRVKGSSPKSFRRINHSLCGAMAVAARRSGSTPFTHPMTGCDFSANIRSSRVRSRITVRQSCACVEVAITVAYVTFAAVRLVVFACGSGEAWASEPSASRSAGAIRRNQKRTPAREMAV